MNNPKNLHLKVALACFSVTFAMETACKQESALRDPGFITVATYNVASTATDPLEYDTDLDPKSNETLAKIWDRVVPKEAYYKNLSDAELAKLGMTRKQAMEKGASQDKVNGPTIREIFNDPVIAQALQDIGDAPGVNKQNLQQATNFLLNHSGVRPFYAFRDTRFTGPLKLDLKLKTAAASMSPILGSSEQLEGAHHSELTSNLARSLYTPEKLQLTQKRDDLLPELTAKEVARLNELKVKVKPTDKEKLELKKLTDKEKNAPKKLANVNGFLKTHFKNATRDDLEAIYTPEGQALWFLTRIAADFNVAFKDNPELIEDKNLLSKAFIKIISDPNARAISFSEQLKGENTSIVGLQEIDKSTRQAMQNLGYVTAHNADPKRESVVYMKSTEFTDLQDIHLANYIRHANRVALVRATHIESSISVIAACLHGNSGLSADGREQIKLADIAAKQDDAQRGQESLFMCLMDANTKKQVDLDALDAFLDELGLMRTHKGATARKKRKYTMQDEKAEELIEAEEDVIIIRKDQAMLWDSYVGTSKQKPNPKVLMPNATYKSDHLPVFAKIALDHAYLRRLQKNK